MAKKPNNLHKKIEAEEDDPFARSARVSEETSNDGKFSTYEYAEKKDDRDGDLILQYRGMPGK
jgi:hypothetical protein